MGTDQTVQVFHLGQLSDNRWPGRLSANGIFVDALRIADELDHYYVHTQPSAKTRCIDGRHDPELDENNLGPQVPAGAPGAALAYRLGVDKDDLTRGTFYDDAKMMIDSYARLGLTPGGHRDNAEHDESVGCGAIDSVDKILEHMIDPRLVEDHKRLVRALLGGHFNRDTYLRILGAGLVLSSRSRDYFSGRGEILDLLEQRAPGSVSTLQGHHQEGLVIINFVPDTTLASNRFASEHNGMQAFGYDIWRSKQIAQALFPLPDQQRDRERFIMARVMLTIATLMALTDGSLQVLVRVPLTAEAGN